jgi:hypothetical protein
MIRRLLQRQTLASFDYQWRELSEGGALLTDTWFLENVDRIISDELLCLKREWFAGKRVLDAGFSAPGRALLELRRLALAPLPFGLKRRLIATRRGVDVHQAFDELSPVINVRHDFVDIERWLREDGFSTVERTIEHSELFVRALRRAEDVESFETPRPHPPYWFDRYGTAAKSEQDGEA